MQKALLVVAMVIAAIVVGLASFTLSQRYPLFGLLMLAGFVGLIFFFLSKNRKEAPLAADRDANARLFQSLPGKARLYIVRHGFAAGMQGMDITVDDGRPGMLRGQVKSGRALVADLDPGRHDLHAKLATSGKGTAATLALDLAEGSVTVVRAGTTMGAVTAGSSLTVIDGEAAQRDLAKARFVAWNDA